MPTYEDYDREEGISPGDTLTRRKSTLKDRASEVFGIPPRRTTYRTTEGGAIEPYRGPTDDEMPVATGGVNQEEAERYIRRRLRFLAAIDALREGKLPTNDQLDALFDRLLQGKAFRERVKMLSPEGEVVRKDLRNLLSTLREIIRDKNQEEDIQQFIYHARLAASNLKGQVDLGEGERGEREGPGPTDFFRQITNVARLLVTSSEFRGYILELNGLFQQFFEGFIKAGDMPETRGGRTERQGEQAGRRPSTTEELAETYGHPIGLSPRGPTPASSPPSVQETQPEVIEPDTASDISPPARDKGKAVERGATGEQTPQRREDLIRQFGVIMQHLGSDPDAKEAVMFLIGLMKYIRDRGRRLAAETGRRKSYAPQDANMQVALHELRRIIERFANNHSLEPILQTLQEFGNALVDDYELRNTLDQTLHFLERSLEEPDFTTHPDYVYQGSEILRRLREILYERYRDPMQRLLREVNGFVTDLTNDRLTQKLAEDLRRLSRDLFFDEKGNWEFKTGLLSDLANVVLPAIIEQIKYIPIPRIEHWDENYHIVVENIIMTAETFLPAFLDLKLKHAARVAFKHNIPSKMKHQITLNLRNIQAEVRDIPFYVHKKTFPRIKDSGVADVSLPGDGLSVFMKTNVDWASKERTLVPRMVHVVVDDLRLSIHHTTHDALFQAMSPFLNATLKKQVVSGIQTQIVTWIHMMDRYLTEFKNTYITHPPEDLSETGGIAGRLLSVTGLAPPRKRTVGPAFGRKKSITATKYRKQYGTERPPWATNVFDVEGEGKMEAIEAGTAEEDRDVGVGR
ncbi:hypothetical protein HK104_000533 [Borealophlyctis nickersoniae]|nr:hypothetical protein HK104_000533 [Borealophlyctis nickersoniae]